MEQVIDNVEQSVLEVLRQLPAERKQQVLDFARFIETQEANVGEIDGDAKWEELFASEKSQLVLEKMAKQALADLEAGRARPMIFTGDEIKPG